MVVGKKWISLFFFVLKKIRNNEIFGFFSVARSLSPHMSRLTQKPTTAADLPLEVVYTIILPYVDAPYSCSPVALVNTRTYRSAKPCLGRHQKFESRRWCEQQHPQAYALISKLARHLEYQNQRSLCSFFPDPEDNFFVYHFRTTSALPTNVLDFVREVLLRTSFEVVSTCCTGNGVLIRRLGDDRYTFSGRELHCHTWGRAHTGIPKNKKKKDGNKSK